MSEHATILPFPTTHQNELDPITGQIVRDISSTISHVYRYYAWNQDKPNLVRVTELELEYLPEIREEFEDEALGENNGTQW